MRCLPIADLMMIFGEETVYFFALYFSESRIFDGLHRSHGLRESGVMLIGKWYREFLVSELKRM